MSDGDLLFLLLWQGKWLLFERGCGSFRYSLRISSYLNCPNQNFRFQSAASGLNTEAEDTGYPIMIMKNNNGFTLVDMLIALLILTIGLLGMAKLTVAIIFGNQASNMIKKANIVAESKMEVIRL